jgi:hypothetical protein
VKGPLGKRGLLTFLSHPGLNTWPTTMSLGKPISFINRSTVAVEARTRGSVCPGVNTLAWKVGFVYLRFASALLALRILRQSAFVFAFFILNSRTSAFDYNTFIPRDSRRRDRLASMRMEARERRPGTAHSPFGA